MNNDNFFYAAGKVDQAGEILKKAGLSKPSILKMQTFALTLRMAESRLIKHHRKTILVDCMSVFTEEAQDLIIEGIKASSAVNLSSSELEKIAIRHGTNCSVLGNPEIDSVVSAYMTYAAYALELREFDPLKPEKAPAEQIEPIHHLAQTSLGLV